MSWAAAVWAAFSAFLYLQQLSHVSTTHQKLQQPAQLDDDIDLSSNSLIYPCTGARIRQSMSTSVLASKERGHLDVLTGHLPITVDVKKYEGLKHIIEARCKQFAELRDRIRECAHFLMQDGSF